MHNLSADASTGFLPPEVPVEGAIARALQVELKAPEGRDDLLTLRGNARPLKPPHMYNLTGEILKALASLEVTVLVTLAAYYVGSSEERVYAVASELPFLQGLGSAEGPRRRRG